MCLTVFAYKTDDDYPFILATNRDEFYERPTRAAQFWENHPNLLAGKDLKAGGTWLGITKDHKFAAITNYRDLTQIKENAPSRGHIVTDYLTNDLSPQDYFKKIEQNAPAYNGFNLLYGYVDDLYYFNNQHVQLQKVKPGYHTLSNAYLDSNWPKSNKALTDFKETLNNHPDDPKHYFKFLQNSRQFPDHLLPSTGLPIEKERMVSSIFIQSEDYGTRCSTLLFADPDQETTFIEKTYINGSKDDTNTVTFALE